LNAQDIYATFDVKADQEAQLGFSTSGIVKEIFFDIGDKVKKGDILAVLDNKDLEALRENARVALRYAKKDYDRQKQVKKYINPAQLDQFARAYETAKAQLSYQEALLDKTILKAPFDGTIVSKGIEVGDVVTGQLGSHAFGIHSLDNMKLVLKFDSKYYNSVKVGDRFVYRLDGSNQEYNGTISKIYPAIDITSRTIGAEVEVEGLASGLFGTGTIKAGQ
ncbi:MAG TPA: efflux RND transporter periplasmic adaptor subunit, partial [Epsilonproteobacteria bacterium]|nr:efflux RND transporter periplasmic adaptor subunit [Campylobacterota bacterium]